jgi:hypothetical protein
MVKLRNGNVLVDVGGTYAEVTQQVAEYIQRLRDDNKQHIVLDYGLAKSLTDVN